MTRVYNKFAELPPWISIKDSDGMTCVSVEGSLTMGYDFYPSDKVVTHIGMSDGTLIIFDQSKEKSKDKMTILNKGPGFVKKKYDEVHFKIDVISWIMIGEVREL